MATKSFSLIVAATQKRGIGLNGTWPWPKLKGDVKFFKQKTTDAAPEKINAVIMGRKTYASIGAPLPGRLNIILSRQTTFGDEVKGLKDIQVSSSFEDALTIASTAEKVDKIFVIGGAVVYQEAMKSKLCQTIFLTQVLKDFKFDTEFPPITSSFVLETVGDVIVEKDIPYQFLTYERKEDNQKSKPRKNKKKRKALEPSNGKIDKISSSPPHDELSYLALVNDVILTGNKRGDRTGVGTISKFGGQLRFNLVDQFPLLTTKSVFFRGVAEELLWFIKGCTDSKVLSEKKIKIWDGNGSREFLDKSGFKDREVGDLGPVYGFQWRHFGATYKDCKSNYDGCGFDQLADVIRLIKKDPTSRRILMSAWNPSDLSKMALPPCHVLAQFYVNEGTLSCQMYQRSADLGLGVPFNIASYALLTYLIAHACDLKPAEFIHIFGDVHVYLNHVEPLKEQLKREPRPFPKLVINPKVKNIDEITMSDITLVDYKPYPAIKMEMAV